MRAGGTLPILTALADRGIPTVMAGLALPDSHTHSPNEQMLLGRSRSVSRPPARRTSPSAASVPAAGQPERRVDEPDVAVRLREVAALLERGREDVLRVEAEAVVGESR